MSANDRQVGGQHYKVGGEEHWDRVARLGLDYFQAQVTKYVERWKSKNGVEDLLKAQHFLDKYLELNGIEPTPTDLASMEKLAVVQASPHVVLNLGRVNLLATGEAMARWLSQVKPDGWIGFTFEGADGDGFLFTCKECREHFRVPQHVPPSHGHECGDAGPGYVSQD